MPLIRLPEPLKRSLGVPIAFAIQLALRVTGRRAGVAVLYHRVADPAGDPVRELVPALGTAVFRSQLRHLRAAYRIVPASELIAAAAGRRRGQRFPLAITFDDDLASHLDVAVPELDRLGVTATFFLTGATLRAPRVFWWQRLQAAVDRGAVPVPSGIHTLALEFRDASPAERDARVEALGAAGGPESEDPGLPAASAARLVAGSFEIGFHTLRHDTLPFLDDPELERAMHEGRAELEALAGAPLSTVAYPHGQVDDRVLAAARRAGFATGFTTRERAVTPSGDPLLAGRIDASPRSAGHQALTVARALMRAGRSREHQL